MENKPPRVQIFNNFDPLLAVSIVGLFNNEITTTPNGISTVIIRNKP